jgi:acyl carrier protein
MTENEIRGQLRDWIFNRAKHKPASLTDDTPLLDKGVLTSLDIVELVLFIERLRGGAEVAVEDLDPAAFHNVNAMYAAFFAPA